MPKIMPKSRLTGKIREEETPNLPGRGSSNEVAQDPHFRVLTVY